MEVQDLGILSGVEAVGMHRAWTTTKPEEFRLALRSNNKALMIKHDNPEKKVSIPVYHLTAVGREIYRLVQPQPHLGYLKKLGMMLQGQGFSVLIGDAIEAPNGAIHCVNQLPINDQ